MSAFYDLAEQLKHEMNTSSNSVAFWTFTNQHQSTNPQRRKAEKTKSPTRNMADSKGAAANGGKKGGKKGGGGKKNNRRDVKRFDAAYTCSNENCKNEYSSNTYVPETHRKCPKCGTLNEKHSGEFKISFYKILCTCPWCFFSLQIQNMCCQSIVYVLFKNRIEYY